MSSFVNENAIVMTTHDFGKAEPIQPIDKVFLELRRLPFACLSPASYPNTPFVPVARQHSSPRFKTFKENAHIEKLLEKYQTWIGFYQTQAYAAIPFELRYSSFNADSSIPHPIFAIVLNFTTAADYNPTPAVIAPYLDLPDPDAPCISWSLDAPPAAGASWSSSSSAATAAAAAASAAASVSSSSSQRFATAGNTSGDVLALGASKADASAGAGKKKKAAGKSGKTKKTGTGKKGKSKVAEIGAGPPTSSSTPSSSSSSSSATATAAAAQDEDNEDNNDEEEDDTVAATAGNSFNRNTSMNGGNTTAATNTTLSNNTPTATPTTNSSSNSSNNNKRTLTIAGSIDDLANDSRICKLEVLLKPRQPTPADFNITVEFSVSGSKGYSGVLAPLRVEFIDLFSPVTLPNKLRHLPAQSVLSQLFELMWKDIESQRSSDPLPGSGLASVKRLRAGAAVRDAVLASTLARFVVEADPWAESGGSFTNSNSNNNNVSGNGKAGASLPASAASSSSSLAAQSAGAAGEGDAPVVRVFIFIPPKYHVLLRVHCQQDSTLVEVVTDHWKLLPYIDSALNSMFV